MTDFENKQELPTADRKLETVAIQPKVNNPDAPLDKDSSKRIWEIQDKLRALKDELGVMWKNFTKGNEVRTATLGWLKVRYDAITCDIDLLTNDINQVETKKEALQKKQEEEKFPTQEATIHLQQERLFYQQEELLKLKKEAYDVEEQLRDTLRSWETFDKNKLNPVEIQEYKTMKNTEFLEKLAPSERLRVITVGNITSEAVWKWDTKELEFTFTYDGVYNRDLFVRTTAGQVLPPEVREIISWGETFTRIGVNGEFFTALWKRLIIWEGTKAEISKLDKEEAQKIQQETESIKEKYKDKGDQDLISMALDKGIDPDLALVLYEDILKTKPSNTETEKKARQVMIEDLVTNISRLQDDFSEDYPGTGAFTKNEGVNKATAAFAVYILGALWKQVRESAEKLWFQDIDDFKQYNREDVRSSRWWKTDLSKVDLNKVNIVGVTSEEKDRVLKSKIFNPYSREAVLLFSVAAQSAWLPVEWAQSEGLHYILQHESNGVVGRLNYTIPKSITPDLFKQRSLELRTKNPIGVTSTASGLWQLLLSNVDQYYPDGREGLGDPLNEAVGMLRYIKDRYGDPDVARKLYWTTGSVGNCVKTFAEGY